MAGIYGAFDMNGTSKTEALAALLNKMSSYTAGSEGQAHLCEQLAISSKRLSNQNIGGAVYDNNRGISVAFEGEIYNKAELREKLSQSGVKPSDNSDAQIILELFGLYKTKCFELLKGMYAFLVYSKEDNALYLVRDRAGEKPLYYAQKDGILLFSGDLNCISCSNVVSKNINATALGQYLLIGYIPSPLTIYEEISAVEPGTYLKITQNGIEHNEYWKLVCSEEAMITDYDKCKSQLRNTLIKSVEDLHTAE